MPESTARAHLVDDYEEPIPKATTRLIPPTTERAAYKYLCTVGSELSLVPDKLATDDLLRQVIPHNPGLVAQFAEQDLEPSLAIELFTVALAKDGLLLRFAPRKWRHYDLYYAAVGQTHEAMHWVPESAYDETLLQRAASHGCLWVVPVIYRTPAIGATAVRRCASNVHLLEWTDEMRQYFRSNGLGGFVPGACY